ncbi:MAG: hypothetical protein JWO68_1599 [Actinomycetia bacterium]|nr:hypothetical protein [Actinomycetes bacterium]
MRYVALLRAVNVGGRKVEMAKLRAAVEELGFDNVATYIASGNLFFDTSMRSKPKVVDALEVAMKDAFGFEVPVALRTVAELEAICDSNPFEGWSKSDDHRLLVNFHMGTVPKLDVPSTSPKGELELVGATSGETFVVAHVVNGKWGTEKWLDTGPATTRFWHTTAKILAAAQK